MMHADHDRETWRQMRAQRDAHTIKLAESKPVVNQVSRRWARHGCEISSFCYTQHRCRSFIALLNFQRHIKARPR